MLTLTLLGACLLAWGCRTVPVSGRKAMVIVKPESSELALGMQAYQEILKEEPVSTNAQYAAMVRRVGERIAAVAGREDFQWEFNVLQSEDQNAFCLPGGKVAVYEGILPVCESEAGLAVVMSHEIAHALARHGGERMQQKTIQQVGNTGIELAGHWLYEEKFDRRREIILTAYGVGSEYLGILPYSRRHESEADQIGLMLMAEAGYDPSEAPRFWERFAATKAGSEQPEWLSTHPSDARRASDLRERLPEALEIYSRSAQQHGLGDRIAVVESTRVTVPDTGATRLR